MTVLSFSLCTGNGHNLPARGLQPIEAEKLESFIDSKYMNGTDNNCHKRLDQSKMIDFLEELGFDLVLQNRNTI